jgi:hypothetical protein
MIEIDLKLEKGFHNHIDHLRKFHYTDGVVDLTSKDALDDVGTHLVAYNSGVPIGTVRLTIENKKSEDSVYEKRIANLTKSVVIKSWRRKGLYKLLMLEIVIHSFDVGCDLAIAKIPLTIITKKFLLSLGFEIVGKPTISDDSPFGAMLCENIQLDLRRNMQKIVHARNELFFRFQTNNVVIKSNI